MSDIPINLAVEDPLSEAILREMLKQTKRPFFVTTQFSQSATSNERTDNFSANLGRARKLTRSPSDHRYLIGKLCPEVFKNL